MQLQGRVLQRPTNASSPAIVLAFVVIIVYGSLYPFRFYHNPDPAGPFRALLSTWHAPAERSDLLANFILYFPLGFFAVRSSRWRSLYAFIVVVAAGLALSMGSELLQFYEALRFSQLSDVYANTVGTIFGALAGIAARDTNIPGIALFRRRDFVIFLILCWLGYRLFPYVPVVDLHKYWAAIKPIVNSPTIEMSALYRHVVTWLALSMLLEALLPENVTRLAVCLLFVLVVCLRLMIIDVVFSLPELIGAVIGIMLWILLLWRMPARASIIAGLFVGLIVLQALEPFQFAALARPFGWIPFRSFLNGSEEAGIPSLFEKSFNYGCLVWLIARSGFSWSAATGAGAALVFVVRLVQVYIPGRSAEITDVIILLMVASIMKVMEEDRWLASSSSGHKSEESAPQGR